jgi:hypothetical protein
MGLECQYEKPYWVTKDQDQQQQQQQPQLSADPLMNLPKEKLIQMINDLKNRSVKPMIASEPLDETSDVFVDFYAHYNSLSMKKTSHEDHKPLCGASLHKKDHYTAFFICYLFLALQPIESTNYTSKWLKLLDLDNEDAGLKEAVKKIAKDRMELQNSMVYRCPNEKVESLIEEILAAIPKMEVLQIYLDYFFTFMWSLRCLVDKETFKKDIHRIIQVENGKVTLHCDEKHDIAILGLLLVILRYTYTSVMLIDEDNLEPDTRIIRDNVISVKAITLTCSCISYYRIFRKSTLPVLQTLLLIRCYFRDAPEDGDGMTLLKSQNLFGLILQSALQMGLNRDPVHYSQMKNNLAEANLRRRLWHHIVSMDAYCAVFAGTIPTIPDSNCLDVNFPLPLSIDSLEHIQRDLLIRTAPLNELYFQICKLVNNIKEKTSLNKLMKLLKESRIYVDSTLNIDSMKSLNGIPKGSKEYIARMVVNVKIFTCELIQTCMELQIYFSLNAFFESNLHVDLTRYKKYLVDILESVRKIYDLAGGYLMKDLEEYLPQECHFEIMPFLNSAMFRAFTCATSATLRFYHVREVIAAEKKHHKGMTVEHVDEFLNEITLHCDFMMDVVYKTLAPKYYSALKLVSFYRYGFSILKTHQFKAMVKIIRFLESSEREIDEKAPISRAKRDQLKRDFLMDYSLINVNNGWMQLSNMRQTEDTLVNIQTSNLFLEFTKDELEQIWKKKCEFKFCKALLGLEYPKEPLKTRDYCPAQDEIQDLVFNGNFQWNSFEFLNGYTTGDDLFDDFLRSLDNAADYNF